MKLKRKRIKIGFVVFLLGCIVLFCYQFLFSKKVEVFPVSSLNQGSNSEVLQISGIAYDPQSQKILPDADKRVSEIYVQKGQTVQKGTPLFKYDVSSVEIALNKNELKIQQLQNKIQTLQVKQEGQKEQIQSYQLELKREQLEQEKNQMVLKNGIYYSDYDGVVQNVKNISHDSHPEEPFMEIAGGQGMKVNIELPESELEKIKVKDEVYFHTMDMSKSYQGEIMQKDSYPEKIDGNISYYRVVAWIQEAEDLKTGTELEVSFPQNQDFGIWLENAYIRNENNKKYVYKVGKNGRLKKTYIKTGQTNYGMATEVLSGLKETDQIAFPYGKDVKEGARIQKSVEGGEKS